ncbi:MAG TPA: hypothetical protein VF944_10840 [Candidatus Bathyarchaeia archaeon]
MKIVDRIKAALAYAKFENPDIQGALDSVLSNHKTDLHDVGYEESTSTEAALVELDNILNEMDSNRERRREDLSESIARSHEEPSEES